MIKTILNHFKGGRIEDPSRPVEKGNISIGITTFEARFNSYFVPLVKKIREYEEEIEIIVAVNGEHERDFGEAFRGDMLRFLASQRNVYPIMFPRFRGLSKLWNSIIIHATHDYILMLNDDVMISSPGFFDDVLSALRRKGGRSFLINRSWSHFVASREEIDALGYFDERLLGIGEEDGDMTWRYIEKYGSPVESVKIKGIANYAEESVNDYKPLNITSHSGTKYSLFNRQFMFDQKYRTDPGGIQGMFDNPVAMVDRGKDQYPHEVFYRRFKEKL